MIKKINKGASSGLNETKPTEKPRRQVDKQRKIHRLRTAQEETHRKSAYFEGPTVYKYERGPDGKTYVVDASTSVDTSPVPGDPQATIRKMESIQRDAKEISEAVIQQAVEEAKRNEQVAKAALETSGLDEHEISVRGDKSESRLGEASAASEDLVSQEGAKTDQANNERVLRHKGTSSRALNTYRGSGSVTSPSLAQLDFAGIKAK